MATYTKIKLYRYGRWVYLSRAKPGERDGEKFPKVTTDIKKADNFWDREVEYYIKKYPKLQFHFVFDGNKVKKPLSAHQIRTSPMRRIHGSRVSVRTKTGSAPRRHYEQLVKTTKSDICPKCKIRMKMIDTIVEHDERPYGDQGDGDWEHGTSAVAIYKCPECEREYEKDLGSKWSGVLR